MYVQTQGRAAVRCKGAARAEWGAAWGEQRGGIRPHLPLVDRCASMNVQTKGRAVVCCKGAARAEWGAEWRAEGGEGRVEGRVRHMHACMQQY